MKLYRADLHIHSCLSPCAELDMSPRYVVQKSLEKGLDIIAVCDHNSAENIGAVIRASTNTRLHVFPGMEINSREEVHTLAIFDTEDQVLAMQEIVYRNLQGTNRPELFGDQVVANEFDEVDGFNDRRLIGATQLKLQEIIEEVNRLGGLNIASHIDKQHNSILSQLGFIPPDMCIDALEISYNTTRETVCRQMQQAVGLSFVTFSDAHFPEDIGKVWTRFYIECPSVYEIRMALTEKAGRRVAD